MDFERLSRASSFTFSGISAVQEPPRAASQFRTERIGSQFRSSNENSYPNYNNNGGNASNAQFHYQRGSTTNYNNNNNNNISNSSNGLNNINSNLSYFNRRFTPYYNKRSNANASVQLNNQRGYHGYLNQQQYQQQDSEYDNSLVAVNGCQSLSVISCDANNNQSLALTSSNSFGNGSTLMSSTKNTSVHNTNGNASLQEMSGSGPENSSCVTLQISNLDSTFDEHALKQHLINKLKPITSVISIYFEAISVAKIKLPSPYHAKLVISFLHRKKIGHKRITVSYTRESSSMEPSTLRCQVVGILKVSRVVSNYLNYLK